MDSRNSASAESYLRRALEALLDLGRHILAKEFGTAAPEYKGIAEGLFKHTIIDEQQKETFRILAGYRNRMVHFYNEISEKELYDICINELSQVESLLETIIHWINTNPEKIDRSL